MKDVPTFLDLCDELRGFIVGDVAECASDHLDLIGLRGHGDFILGWRLGIGGRNGCSIAITGAQVSQAYNTGIWHIVVLVSKFCRDRSRGGRIRGICGFAGWGDVKEVESQAEAAKSSLKVGTGHTLNPKRPSTLSCTPSSKDNVTRRVKR